MYEIMVDDHISTADSLLGALRALREQLQPVLLGKDHARWQVTDPAGLEHRGIDYLNGRTDRLDHLLDDTCDQLYVQLHYSADGYPESIKTGTATVAAGIEGQVS